MLADMPNIFIPELTGNIKEDVQNLLVANGQKNVFDHVAAVAKVNIKIAVAKALTKSLEAASLAYMTFIVENKKILYPHRWFSEGMDYLRTHL